MWKNNDGCGESNILQNQFTAYLVSAIGRKKFRYQQNKKIRQYNERSLDLQEYLPELRTEPDMLETLPFIAQLENVRLQQALKKQKARDLYILFAKVIVGRSLVKIANDLGMEYQAVAAVYYRLIAKLKKEIRGDDE